MIGLHKKKINKTFEDYKKREEITKKYASQIKEEIDELMPHDFWTEADIQSSIESILDEMYKELKPND